MSAMFACSTGRFGQGSLGVQAPGVARWFWFAVGDCQLRFYFFFLGELVFFSLLYRVFLPLAILGSSFLTRSMSSSVHRCTVMLPVVTDLGAGILPAVMYVLSVVAGTPSFRAACCDE